MSKKKDITQTGPVGLRGIRNSDLYDYLNSGVGNSAIVRQALSSGPSTPFGPNKADDYSRYYEPTVEEDTSWKELGNSSYDAPYMIGSDPSYIGEHRAQEQSGITQLANGILKGVGLAGTTFLDGTVGLLAGVADGIYNAANGEGWEGFAEGFFNNDVSKTLREVNAEMEKILPNYRTKDEIENPWALRNIFSMNTFADDFLKNMGFTVGAFYSGNAFLGALKGVGLAAKMSKTAASTIGSVVSGFNEGRIEAGNLYDEMLTAEIGNLKAARDQARQEILDSPEYQAAGQSLIDEYNQKKAVIEAMPDKLVPNGEGGYVSQKQQALIQLGNEYSGRLSQLEQQAMVDIDRRYDQQVKDAQHRAAQAGIADMILNTLYLPGENMFAYGKLYGRKFKPKADLKKGVKEKAIDVAAREADLEETMGRRIAREGKEYVATPRSAKKAALRGLGVGISEGAEEINQSAMSSFASNLYQPDSPDAYYKALTNDDYHMETKDAMTAFSEAMVDSWGNPDTYKEGLVGFLTGLIGMPTFGRVNNSDAVTYLGKGSPVALSGGILGEISNNRRLNAEANRAVDAMNKVVKLASDTENFFVRMNSFYDAKAGFSEENDKFEFNNAADNELFHAIDAFRRSGRMQDLKDIIDENFDNITPEQLADIAEKTTGEDNLWSDIDGTSMAATPDGQTEMKRILNDRKQEIMDGIESYEKALDEVRSIANNSLDEDQTAELAWLKWKVDKFGKRYADIKENNRDLFTDISNALLNYRDELQNGIDDSVADDEDNIAVQELNKTNNLIKFIAELQGAPTPMALSAILEAHPNFVKYFTRTDSQFAGYDSFNGMLGVSYDQYERAWNELRDCTRLAKAAKDFDSRYKEFTQDPIKLIQNRQKIDAQNAKQEESKKNLKGRNLLDSDNVSDIVKAVDNGEMSLEDMQKLIDTDADSDVKEKRQQMYDNAAAILKRAQELEDKLNALADEPGADPQAIEDAKRQLEKQKYLVENAEQLADTSTEAMNTMEMSDEDVQRALAAGQALEDAEAERIDKAKELIKSAEARLEESQQALGNMPTEMPKGLEEAVAAAEADDAGHDGPTAVPAINEPQAQDSPTPINYYNIAYNDVNALVPSYSEDKKTNAANALARLYANIDSKHREGTLAKNDGILFEATDDFKAAGRLIGDNNARVLLANRIDKVLANDAAQLAPNDPAPIINQDPVTPDTSNIEAIEKQIDAEANRSLDEDSRQDSYNYWKRTTTQYFIHSPRAAWEKTIDWIKRQAKSPQQVRRTEAVYQFLEDHHAWDNINAGAVAMKGRKGPTIKFITSKKLNDDAGEFVVLMVDSQGRIVGDLGSKNDIGTHRQVGLVDFLDAAEKEYNEKKDKTGEDIVPLTGETTVLQNLVGRVDYAPKDQRRSLNEIWGGKKFIIALARKSGKNSGMRTNSLSLSATGGKDDIGDYTLSPLDAVAGQPYVLVESSDPARRYIPVPFSMPVFSPATTNSALGQAILKVLMTVSEEDFKTIRDPLRALLAVEDVRIGWGTKTDKNADRVTLTIQRNGKKEYYSAQRSDPNAGTVLFNKLAQAGIPFHVNRAFINGTYGPTGQSYNEMIGELAQTNLNSTHTVGDWFTVNPIGAKGTRMKSIGINPEAEANQKAAEAVVARGAGRITVNYNGFEYTVDKDTWKVYNSENKELIGGFATQIVALAQCQLNGYDITKPGPYQIPLGWYNPVTGALNREGPKQEQRPQIPAQPQGQQPQQPSAPQAGQSAPAAINSMAAPALKAYLDRRFSENNVDTAELNTLVDDIVAKNDRDRAVAVEDILSGVLIDRSYKGVDYKPLIDQLNPIRKKYMPVLRGEAQPQAAASQPANEDPYVAHKRWVETNMQTDKALAFLNTQDTAIQTLISDLRDWIDKLYEYDEGLYDGKLVAAITKENLLKTILAIPVINRNDGLMLASEDIKRIILDTNPKLKAVFGQSMHGFLGLCRQLIALRDSTINQTQDSSKQPTQDVLAKMADILDDDVKQAVWDSLTEEQKQALASKSTKKIEQILDTIVEEAWDGTKVDNFESYLGARFRRGEVTRTSRKWNEKKEKAWLKQVLPQFSGHRLRVLRENLIQISGGENPTWAYGQFKNGIITLGKAAAKGTLYHEAFHAVTWCLFNESERHQMLEAAKGKYKTANPIALEEQLAEDFRKYVQLEELPVVGRLVRFFRTLKQFIRSLTGKENYIDKVFYSISRGAYANREVQDTDIARLNKPTEEEEEILTNAPRDSEGRLLAPNGKPSNLTERQYIQVRTKAFKDWFGDWENDPENASKVVDENGEPLVVYHHTDNPNLTEFSIDFDNYFTKDGGTKKAVFFDENKTGTLNRKYDVPVFLNIRDLHTYNGTKEDLHKAGTTYRAVVNESAEANDITGGLHMHDFDDNKLEHQDVWIVHNPTQIKSATDNIGTFDPNNPDIRYRKVLPSEAATKSLQNAKHTLTIINSSPIDITKLGSYLSDLFKRYKDRFSSEEKFTEEIKFYASLIEYLRRNNAINENGVLFKFLTVPKANGNIVQGFRNYYGIGINQKVPFEDEPIVLLHEIIHSATVAAIESPKTEAEKTFAKKLTALYKYVVDWNNKNHMIPSDEYGLTDVYEFVAEMANPYFLQSLSMIEVTSDYPYLEENAQRIRKSNPNRSNALVQFLNALKEYLGALWRHKANRAHAQLLSIYDEWVTNSGPEKFDGVFVGSKTGDKIRKEGVVSYARVGIEQSKPMIEQYHRDRLEFGNLSQEQKDYIEMRGITLNEYNRMSEFEREVLFECMGI